MHRILAFIILTVSPLVGSAQQSFRVISFFTGRDDAAHISFVNESHPWFRARGAENNFTYDTTSNWANLNSEFLSKYDVIIFPDTRPESREQRIAFEQYMEAGGAWLGFHFAAFALTPSKYAQDWDWYHETFLGSGQYRSNTWRPTSAVLRVEDRRHPVMKKLPATFQSAPNEWYRWENDLTSNPDIRILASIDSSSFPLGTGPKSHEIWHDGYYPVVWTNTRYRMIYINMGHNDMDYEHGTNASLSSSFSSDDQNSLILQSLLWLGRKKRK